MARQISGVSTEPVSVAIAARYVLVLIVGAGWLSIPDATINTIASGIAIAVDLFVSWRSRGKVTPVEDPRNNAGAALMPYEDKEG